MSRSDTIANIILRVNGQEAYKTADLLRQKISQAAEAKRQLEAAHAGGETWTKKDINAYQRLTKEINRSKRELDNMQASGDKVRQVMNDLGKSGPTELTQALKALEAAQRKVTRGSEDWKELSKAIADTKRQINAINEENKASLSLTDRFKDISNQWMGVSTSLTALFEGLDGIRGVLNSAVNDFAEMSEHMADVTKYTGLTADAVGDLNEAFKNMDTRTPREKLNDLAADAGRLGIQSKQQVLDFVQAADQINVALGEDLGEDEARDGADAAVGYDGDVG